MEWNAENANNSFGTMIYEALKRPGIDEEKIGSYMTAVGNLLGTPPTSCDAAGFPNEAVCAALCVVANVVSSTWYRAYCLHHYQDFALIDRDGACRVSGSNPLYPSRRLLSSILGMTVMEKRAWHQPVGG